MTYSKWELARYLIDAKKCVDSIMFIARHKKSLANINLRKKIHDIQQEFYIKCCVYTAVLWWHSIVFHSVGNSDPLDNKCVVYLYWLWMLHVFTYVQDSKH